MDSNWKDVLNRFLNAYAERDESTPFSKWLADILRQELPELGEEAGENLAGEIIVGVADYNDALHDLNRAIEAGSSKEEWLAEQLADAYAGMPPQEAGDILRQARAAFFTSNAELVGEQSVIDIPTEEAEEWEWNDYTLKSAAYEYASQCELLGEAAAGKAYQQREQSANVEAGSQISEKAHSAPNEVETVIVGALRVAVEKGLLALGVHPLAIYYIAGVAVEGANAVIDLIHGRCTVMEALDRVGRAAVAGGCQLARAALQGTIQKIPVVGPVLVELLGGLFEHMESETFHENVHNVFHDAANAIWKGIKKRFGLVDHRVKKLLEN